jgi:hypothetical protein
MCTVNPPHHLGIIKSYLTTYSHSGALRIYVFYLATFEVK